uniref:CASPASE_P20 domain-containing protein n=1 Tax=Macrostomum lignano TaxID=282301 RepID=A0A1I8JFD3_9PLAT
THEDRDGSQLDVQRVNEVFQKLRFTVQLEEDLTANEILQCLMQLQRCSDQLERHGCFVCFLMAHGSPDCVFGSDGRPCRIPDPGRQAEDILHPGLPRSASRCTPRRQQFEVQRAASPGARAGLLPPAKADFLLCYATTENQYSYRFSETGSKFVQTLCRMIERHYAEDDLLNIMTRVNRDMMQNPVENKVEKTTYLCVAQTVAQLGYKISLDPSLAKRCWRRLQNAPTGQS